MDFNKAYLVKVTAKGFWTPVKNLKKMTSCMNGPF